MLASEHNDASTTGLLTEHSRKFLSFDKALVGWFSSCIYRQRLNRGSSRDSAPSKKAGKETA